MNYTVAQDSRIGGRQINQDSVAWEATEDAVLLVVADGMGGHLQGEIAAKLATDILVDRFKRNALPRLSNPAHFLFAAMYQAHQRIARYSVECGMPPHAAPRTTCVACVVQDGQACWAHAGDSRLYLIRGPASALPAHVAELPGQRFSFTRDHSTVQRLLDEGKISPAEIGHHPLRNQVLSCLGGDTTPQIEVSGTVALADGDVIALCTDGAWSLLHDDLANHLTCLPLDRAVPELMATAAESGGKHADNLSLIALRWQASHSPLESRND